LIEKKSPFDGVAFLSLSRTWTSKRHDGDVVFSLVGHALKLDGDPEVSL